jgi:uncharacterized membrane protein YesL
MYPFSLMWQALRVWWKSWISILLLNMVWFLLLIPIISAPAATVMFWSMTRKIVEDDVWDWKDALKIFREHFFRAWLQFLPYLLLGFMLVYNFYAYSTHAGMSWSAIRLFWGVIIFVWILVGLFYWPFWFSQEDKSVSTTLKNILAFFQRHSFSGIVIIVVSVTVLFVSIRFVLPFVLGIVGWGFILVNLAVCRSLDIAESA